MIERLLVFGVAMMTLAWAGCEPEGKTEGAGKGEGAAAPEAEVEAAGEKQDELGWITLAPKEGMGEWKQIAFGGEGDAGWKEGVLTIGEGAELSGVVWGGKLPEAPYEIELEGRRMSGVDFFCGLTFPVRDPKTCVTLVVGGWGGGLVGISSIDGLDASENNSTEVLAFKDEQWYKIRLQIRKNHLAAWIDDKQLIDEDTEGHELGLRFGDIEKCAPLGISTFQTKAELRGLRWRPLK